MQKTVKPVPDGYHTVTPYLIVRGAAQAMDFYARAFGASETLRLTGPKGSIVHAELRIGNSPIMLGEESAAWEAFAPPHFNGSPVTICLYLSDVDAAFRQAVDAGATAKRPPADQFYGDRTANVLDPYGHTWHLATRKEDLTREQMQRRHDEWMRKQQQQMQAQA